MIGGKGSHSAREYQGFGMGAAEKEGMPGGGRTRRERCAQDGGGSSRSENFTHTFYNDAAIQIREDCSDVLHAYALQRRGTPRRYGLRIIARA